MQLEAADFSSNATKQIEQARKRLHEIETGLAELLKLAEDEFSTPEMQRAVNSLKSTHREAVAKLEEPSLTIATFGTTSSGKSTLVNAMLGRRLAPIEAGEMSAGILRFAHSEQRAVTVKDTAGAVWETGRTKGMTDEGIYRLLRGNDGVMRQYHREVKERDIAAPRLDIEVPVLPGKHPELLHLPENTDFQMLDLPGLKSLNDADNLRVIRDVVGEAFSLVVLDYNNTDEAKRSKLINELRDVVEFFDGQTDAMVFVLNKIDARKSTDNPLEERIENLRADIRSELGLKTAPEIIPLQALAMFHAHCAWGPTTFGKAPKTTDAARKRHLKSLFEDLNPHERASQDHGFQNWYKENLDAIMAGNLDIDTHRELLDRFVSNWSGSEYFWRTLQRRMEESFSALVIYPAVSGFLAEFETFLSHADQRIELARSETIEELNKKREAFEDAVSEARLGLEERKSFFSEKIEEATGLLEEDIDAVARRKGLREKITELGIPAEEFVGVVSNVSEQLRDELIRPVRRALIERRESSQLRRNEDLQDVLPPRLQEALPEACGLLTHNDEYTDQLAKSDSGFEIELDKSEEAINKLAKLEKDMRRVYQRMKEALAHRGEFLLQGKAARFEEGMRSTIRREIQSFRESLEELGSDGSQFAGPMDADLGRLQDPDAIRFPADVLSSALSAPDVEEGTDKRIRYIDNPDKGSCFGEEKIKDSYDVDTVTIHLRSPKQMARDWEKGIEASKSDFWETVFEWTRSSFASFLDELSTAINRAERAMQEAHKFETRRLEEERAVEIGRLDEIDAQLETLGKDFETLSRAVRAPE